MDPCNTKFLMKFKDTLIQTITRIIIIPLTTGQYLDEWKNGSSLIPHKRTKSGHGLQELLPNKPSFIEVKIN